MIALVVSCSPSPPDTGAGAEPAPPSFGHVHGVDMNPADGSIWAATHHGMFELTEAGPVHVADRYQDTMGFTIVGPDRFLASGHPDVREQGPPHLGLVVSTDRARTWRALSLSGEADFHALTAADSTVYGLDATDGLVMRSDDGGESWQAGAVLPATDLDIDPAEPLRVVAATPHALMESVNGGAAFSPLIVQPPRPLVLVDHVDHRSGGIDPSLAGVDAIGGVWERNESGWRATGSLPGPPQAFTVVGADRYLAATDAGVYSSEDAGRSWEQIATARR
jgi:hypothetical protein